VQSGELSVAVVPGLYIAVKRMRMCFVWNINVEGKLPRSTLLTKLRFIICTIIVMYCTVVVVS